MRTSAMIDTVFGSHYIQDAIDLAVLAERQLVIPVPNSKEAIRLYTASIASLELGLTELTPEYNTIAEDAKKRIANYQKEIKRLKGN